MTVKVSLLRHGSRLLDTLITTQSIHLAAVAAAAAAYHYVSMSASNISCAFMQNGLFKEHFVRFVYTGPPFVWLYGNMRQIDRASMGSITSGLLRATWKVRIWDDSQRKRGQNLQMDILIGLQPDGMLAWYAQDPACMRLVHFESYICKASSSSHNNSAWWLSDQVDANIGDI